MSDGTIPIAQPQTVLGIGQWLDVNGEAIYSTRAWKQFGDGNLRFTTKGKDLHVILLGKPGSAIEINALGGSGKIDKIEMLGQPGRVKFTRDATALRIQPPSNLPQSPAYVFKITGGAQSRFLLAKAAMLGKSPRGFPDFPFPCVRFSSCPA